MSSMVFIQKIKVTLVLSDKESSVLISIWGWVRECFLLVVVKFCRIFGICFPLARNLASFSGFQVPVGLVFCSKVKKNLWFHHFEESLYCNFCIWSDFFCIWPGKYTLLAWFLHKIQLLQMLTIVPTCTVDQGRKLGWNLIITHLRLNWVISNC